MVTKKTEIGVLPSDWSVVTLLDCLCGKPSYGINAPAIAYSPQKPRYIRITDITEAGTYSKRSPASVEDVNIDRYYLKENDIVLARTGASVGKSYLYQKDDGNLVYAGFLIKASINDIVADARYVFACLHTQRYWQWVNTVSVRSGQPGINGEEYSAYLLPLPSRTEQTAIADAISDTDRLISSLQKLIEKRKAIKQGAMQELLTGKKRLPGFYGEWKPGVWKDVLAGFYSGATPYRGRADYYKGNIRWVSSGELNYNIIKDTIEHISEKAKSETSLIVHPAGTFLMAITGLEAAGTRGSCAILGKDATTNQSCMAIYGTDKMIIPYLYHYYLLNGEELAFQYCQGTKQQSYTAAIVKELPIYYPCDIVEQQAIAQILSDMDSEIKQLEKKLAKYQQIKQGMMQELLTGRIRLL